jgi:recombination protein RecA
LGLKAGIVEKSGSWFSYDSERIGQGRENAKTYLKEHPDVADAIEAKIRANAGLVSKAMMSGGASEGESDGNEPPNAAE